MYRKYLHNLKATSLKKENWVTRLKEKIKNISLMQSSCNILSGGRVNLIDFR